MSADPTADRSAAARAAVRLAKIVEIGARDVDLTLTQYRLLVYLSEGSAPANALAERLIVSRPSVTTLVDGLVERGLVERIHDEADRRRINHVLTDAGRAVLHEGDRAVLAAIEDIAEHLDPERAESVLAGLEALHEGLDLALEERERIKAAEGQGVPA